MCYDIPLVEACLSLFILKILLFSFILYKKNTMFIIEYLVMQRSNKEENHLDARRDKWKKEGGKEGGEASTTPFA